MVVLDDGNTIMITLNSCDFVPILLLHVHVVT